MDNRWEGVAPFELTPVESRGVCVLRRDFTGRLEGFPVSDIAMGNRGGGLCGSFNEHLTGGLVGIRDSDELGGILVSNARYVLGGIAMCPMSVRGDMLKQEVSLNMFGTYPPNSGEGTESRSGGLVPGLEEAEHRGDATRASYFNGVREKAAVGLLCFAGGHPGDDRIEELVSFSDGALVSVDETGMLHPFMDDNVYMPDQSELYPEGFVTAQERTNDIATRRQEDTPELAAARKELLQYFRNSKKKGRVL